MRSVIINFAPGRPEERPKLECPWTGSRTAGNDRRCASPFAARWWRRVELLEHGYAQAVERVAGFVICAPLIIGHEGEDEMAATGCFRVTGTRAHMLDGTGLCMNTSGGDGALHVAFQRAKIGRAH